MNYYRTKDEIYDASLYLREYTGWYFNERTKLYTFTEGEIIKQADTIEELIQDDDILYIHDLYPDVVLVVEGNIKPFGYNEAIKLKDWLEYKHTEFDLYIKQPNGDYHKVASKKAEGDLKLV